jgi:hypothetical protein
MPTPHGCSPSSTIRTKSILRLLLAPLLAAGSSLLLLKRAGALMTRPDAVDTGWPEERVPCKVTASVPCAKGYICADCTIMLGGCCSQRGAHASLADRESHSSLCGSETEACQWLASAASEFIGDSNLAGAGCKDLRERCGAAPPSEKHLLAATIEGFCRLLSGMSWQRVGVLSFHYRGMMRIA